MDRLKVLSGHIRPEDVANGKEMQVYLGKVVPGIAAKVTRAAHI